MSTLTLVRHGQATWFQADGDSLSPVGETQASCLADFWLKHGITFDEVYSGPLTRQIRTAEIVGRRVEQAGSRWPAIRVVEEWAEYDARGILSKLVPQLAARDVKFRQLVEDYEKNAGGPDRNRYFQRMFEAVILEWLGGDLQSPDVESWPRFQERIGRAVRQIVEAEGAGRRVAVFTSGGPIGTAVQQVLSAPVRSAVELNWRIRNCSLTEFIFSGSRLSLDCFNSVSHLDRTLITHR